MVNAVYGYVPNLIGYARVATGVAAFMYALTDTNAFLWLYSVSYVLDAFDGYAARAMDQCEWGGYFRTRQTPHRHLPPVFDLQALTLGLCWIC